MIKNSVVKLFKKALKPTTFFIGKNHHPHTCPRHPAIH